MIVAVFGFFDQIGVTFGVDMLGVHRLSRKVVSSVCLFVSSQMIGRFCLNGTTVIIIVSSGIVVSCHRAVFIQSGCRISGLQALRTSRISFSELAVCFIIQTAVGNQGAVLHLKQIVVIIFGGKHCD